MKQKIKDFLKSNVAEVYVALCILASISAMAYISSLPRPHVEGIEVTKTIVTQVDYHPSGSISVAQIDPLFTIKTKNGLSITSRHRFEIGDTLIIKKIKYGQLESK